MLVWKFFNTEPLGVFFVQVGVALGLNRGFESV